jgi:hypothetical protein
MKYAFFLLVAFLLAYCSGSKIFNPSFESKSELGEINNEQKSSFNILPNDIVRLIAGFLDAKHITYLRVVNSLTFHSITLKVAVELIFKISGLESIDDNEPELAGVMRMAWTSYDPLLSFAALMEEVVVGKKPYEVIFRPLILYLTRSFRALGQEENREYKKSFYARFHIPFEGYLANICAIKGHHDLAFQIARDDAKILRDFVSKFEDKTMLMKIFGANDQYMKQYFDALTIYKSNHYCNSISIWIAECIINGFPEKYYVNLFIVQPEILEVRVKNLIDHLFFSTDVPEADYSRIHDQIVNFLEIHSDKLTNIEKFTVLQMINNIRFGALNLNNLHVMEFGSLDNQLLCLLAKAALLANNKEELFLYVYTRYKSIFGDGVMDQILSFESLNANSLQAKNFKIIFEMIQTNPDDIFKSESSLLLFVIKFYAVKQLKLEGNLATFEFVASENLLEFGFPEFLIITKEDNDVYNVIMCIFRYMKVFNEDAMNSFMSDFIEYQKILSISQEVNPVSYEFIEFISKLPDLLHFMEGNGIKLGFWRGPETLEKYFNLPNFHLTSKIIQWPDFQNLNLTNLKSQDHLEKMELIEGLPVSDLFLYWEIDARDNISLTSNGNSKFQYFEWRLVFALWLKGHCRFKIRQINTHKFIKMLKLDFPNETKNLLKINNLKINLS